ncbi:MAG: oxidoreductase, partial [Rubrimonas sp.]
MTAALPLSLFAPLVLLAAAVFAFATPGRRPAGAPVLAERAALAALALSAAGVLQLVTGGPRAAAWGEGALAFTLRLDALSATMALLVGFVGWIVVRYSRTYLDGAARE